MSSIAFTSPSGHVNVSGRERAMMGSICDSFRRAQTGDFRYDDLAWVKDVVRPGHYLHVEACRVDAASDDYDRAQRKIRLAQTLDTYLHVGDMGMESAIILDGKAIDLFTLTLNSAIEWGNRAVQLCAKLHGQCEIHAYCEGEDRAWLADLIQEGLDCNVFRSELWGYDGWPKVIEFLRGDASEPVVTSYSVTDSFPSAAYAPEGAIGRTEDGETDWDAWYDIEPSKQWEWGMAALRKEPGLRIGPEQLVRMFGDGLTGREFMRLVRQQAAPAPVAA